MVGVGLWAAGCVAHPPDPPSNVPLLGRDAPASSSAGWVPLPPAPGLPGEWLLTEVNGAPYDSEVPAIEGCRIERDLALEFSERPGLWVTGALAEILTTTCDDDEGPPVLDVFREPARGHRVEQAYDVELSLRIYLVCVVEDPSWMVSVQRHGLHLGALMGRAGRRGLW